MHYLVLITRRLIDFFLNIGVKTDCLDGFRIFPDSHNSASVLDALESELKRLHVKVLCSQ